MSDLKHTAGPWEWRCNTKSGRTAMLVTQGRGAVFVMGFQREGMQSAEPTFQVHKPDCDGECHGCGIMTGVKELIAGTEDHNGDANLLHPDAVLIAQAWRIPSMEAETKRLRALLDRTYSAWRREGWEPDGEDFAEVLGDVAWEIYDRPGAPLEKSEPVT